MLLELQQREPEILSLKEVARSVTEEATEQFIKDVKRFCGSSIANQFFIRFNADA